MNNHEKYVVLIPAYKPDERLITLTKNLLDKKVKVILVDDGGQNEYWPIFQQCIEKGAHVVRHATNMGKGRALKTGINEVMKTHNSIRGVITADADGQHTPDDILKIIDAQEKNPADLILGSRAFSGKVPFKSRAGNAITRIVYRLVSGYSIHDTQTGLRGLPYTSLADMLQIEGERYEYEMNVLLRLKEMRIKVVEVPIETIYIDDNKGSHFNPVKDACKIYGVILKYLFRKK